MINIRLPNITAQTEKGQLEQIRSYLYQFAQELNWAMANIDSKAEEATKKIVATTQQKDAVEQAQATFAEVKSLIIKSADIVNAYYEEISHRLEGVYVAQSDFGTYLQETSMTINGTPTSITAMFENQQTITTDVEGLGNSVESLSGEVETTKGQVSDLDGRVESAESGLAKTNDAVAGLESDLGTTKDNVSNLSNSLEGTNSDVSALNTDLIGTREQVDDLSDSLGKTREQVTTLDSDLSSTQSAVDGINSLIGKKGETTIVRSTNAWCRIGLLEGTTDNMPIYGMEIGQVTINEDNEELFSAYARYCSNGVYLYDQNGNQVATIDQNKIDITNAVISNLVMGGYEISTSNGLTFKWKG